MLGLVGFYSDNFISNINQNIENALRFDIGKWGYTFLIFFIQQSIQDLKRRIVEHIIGSMTEEENKNYNVKDFKVIINPDLKLLIKSPTDLTITS